MTPIVATRFLAAALAVVLAGCAGTPPPPDWQLNAQGAIERAQDAYLSGQGRIEELEFARARAEIARTGRADLLARAELVRCATRVASLVFEPCTGFDAWQADAAPAEQAYARYLQAQATAPDAGLLPPQHRSMLAPAAGGAQLAAVQEPLSRLVAAGVLLRGNRADPQTITLAIDAASSQGWRRPLLAWLGVQAQRAEQAGDADALARIRRRMQLVGGEAPARRP
ncbi:MAG: hypothetical protein KDH91_18480 [Rhodoferax sp.]|nr:hypothetical protein [Rhodoferax sp.]MCW5629221.1 hypothetical protein [Rhodoferax sp.]